MKKIVLVDLDGVLNQYLGKFDAKYIPPIKDGAKEFVQELASDFEVKIFTTRNRLLTAKWLLDNQIDEYISDITNVKEPCQFYIDDRCLQFKGDYKELLEDIKHFSVWWKN